MIRQSDQWEIPSSSMSQMLKTFVPNVCGLEQHGGGTNVQQEGRRGVLAFRFLTHSPNLPTATLSCEASTVTT